MARLLRNAATNGYYTETAMDGDFVTLEIHPDGVEYLQNEKVEEDARIPAETFAVLEQNDWLTRIETPANTESESTDGMSEGAEPQGNLSETNASPEDRRSVSDEPLPSVKLPPRPWAEQENVQAFRDGDENAVAGSDQPARKSRWTQADRDNADAMRHPEAAAFVGSVWMWLLIVVLVVIVVWGIVEFL